MPRPALVSMSAIVFTAFLDRPGVPQGRPPQRAASSAQEEKLVKEILAANDPSSAATEFGALFKWAGADGLRRLMMNSSDTIAVQAAWEEVELTVPEKPERTVRPDRDKLAKFLGFLEGRARVQAPPWWSEAVLDARANRRGNVYAGGFRMADRREPKGNAPVPPLPATFDRQDGKAVVRVGAAFAPVPEDLPEKLRLHGSFDTVSALMTPERCFVAVHGCIGYPYKLACVERASGKLRWISEVWASWWYSATGLHFHSVEVTEQGGRVVVFGVASGTFHVEAFRMEDGINVLRL